MHAADQISVGTVLCHPDGEAVVTDETRTSWKATRGSYEITIAKDTMVARGKHIGHGGHRYVTKARAVRRAAEDLLRKRLTHLMAVSDLEDLTAAVAVLENS